MKKWTSLLLALAMALSLAACGNSGTQENTSEPPASVSGSIAEETPAPTDTEAPAEEPAEEPSEEPAESETPTAGDSSSVLIAYFSWSGNTEQVAQIIQQETGGDLFEIAPATAYTDDYNELLDIAQQEQSGLLRLQPPEHPQVPLDFCHRMDLESVFGKVAEQALSPAASERDLQAGTVFLLRRSIDLLMGVDGSIDFFSCHTVPPIGCFYHQYSRNPLKRKWEPRGM